MEAYKDLTGLQITYQVFIQTYHLKQGQLPRIQVQVNPLEQELVLTQ